MPPNDEKAEQGVLGCCLREMECVRKSLEWFAVPIPGVSAHPRPREVFYDLRHQSIFEVLCFLFSAAKGIDLITVQAELQNRGQLEQVGGIAYLSDLQDAIPSAANLDYYLAIVFEKFQARLWLQSTVRIQQAILERNGISEGGLARAEREIEELKALSKRAGGITPQDLKRSGHFSEEVYAKWFKGTEEKEPGHDLPVGFPMRVRAEELTLVCGDNGSGKSIFLGQIAIALMKQGWKGCIASFEVRSYVSIWMMQRQLLGKGPRMAETPENAQEWAKANSWLNEKLWIYDFLGITDWRLLLDVMRYAREKEKVDFFVIDSVMRIGIAEDDYATQSLAAAEFAGFTVQTGAHVFLVQHLNKSREGGVKDKATGSKRWTDNANNILEMQRHAKKAERIEELKMQRKNHAIEEREYDAEMGKLRVQWDGRLKLAKQRYPGSRQNASAWLWFDEASLQFRDSYDDAPVDYLL